MEEEGRSFFIASFLIHFPWWRKEIRSCSSRRTGGHRRLIFSSSSSSGGTCWWSFSFKPKKERSECWSRCARKRCVTVVFVHFFFLVLFYSRNLTGHRSSGGIKRACFVLLTSLERERERHVDLSKKEKKKIKNWTKQKEVRLSLTFFKK